MDSGFTNQDFERKSARALEDMEEEFRKIDTNKGGQILFSEFIEWALVKNLDLDDDIDCEE